MKKSEFEQLDSKIPKGLTIEKLRTYKGFENVSDTEAEDIILNLRRFAMICCKYYMVKKKLELEAKPKE